MQLFKILNDNKIYKISRANFEKLTDKKYPYCQEIKKRTRYLAICPACENPISFINLYIYDQTDNVRKRATHGRHITKSIPGLAEFNESKYKECPFHKENVGKLYTDIPGSYKNLEVIRLIETYPEELRECLSNILGFRISKNKFQDFLSQFISSKGYYFEDITKFNLPYYFLYLLPNQILYNCKVLDVEIKDEINKNSKYFKVDDNQRLLKKVNEFTEFEFILIEHNKKDEQETIVYKLIERQQEIKNVVFNKKIDINELLFWNMICNKEK